MSKFLQFVSVAACVVAAGCFDNMERPADVPTARSIEELRADSNRTALVRVFLRGAKDFKAEDLSDLPAVEALDLSELGLKEPPSAAYALPKLRQFYFVRNEMEKVPEALAALKLDYLNLDGNKIAALPDSLGSMTTLRWLRLNGNKLSSLPASMAELKGLERIYLRGNQFKTVPEALKDLPALEDVALDGNQIDAVPDWLVAMPSLRHLSLANCPIRKLPDDISGFKRLRILSLSGCPLSPDEVKRIRAAIGDAVAVTF